MIVCRRGVTWDVEGPDNFWSTLWLNGWEDFTLDAVDRFAREEATLVDVGAWVGPVSLWAARRGPVLAVEPDPVALGYLRRNVAENALGSVTVVHGAIVAETGPQEVIARGVLGNSMSSVRPEGPLPNDQYKELDPSRCAGFTLPMVLAGVDRVSLVKMDIEGGECDVLEHVAPYCAERGVPLLVALHQWWWTRPVSLAWFGGFSSVEFCGAGQVLCT